MPEPNRPPWLIAEDLRQWSIWQLVEMGVTLVIHCDACSHEARWRPADRTPPRSDTPQDLGLCGAAASLLAARLSIAVAADVGRARRRHREAA